MKKPKESLEGYVRQFLLKSLGMATGDRLLLYTDRHSDSHLAETMQLAAIELGVDVRWARISDVLSLQEGGDFLSREIREFAPTRICELSEQYYYQTPAWRHGVDGGAQIYSLCGLSSDGFVRCIGQVNHEDLILFGNRLKELLCAAQTISISSGDQVVSMRMGRDIFSRVIRKITKGIGSTVHAPSGVLSKVTPTAFLGGQIAFLGVPASIEGAFIVDSFVWPPANLKEINDEATLIIREGALIEVKGRGKTATGLRTWFSDSRSQLMHVCIGFNPGATFSHGIVEAERVMGGVTLGIGQGERHSDSVSAKATVMFDGEAVLLDGRFVHPELLSLAENLTS